MDQRAEEALLEISRKYDLKNLALIVDISGSMEVAIEITRKLYEAFSRMSTVTDLIAFREYATRLKLKQLKSIKAAGATSIGSAMVLLVKQLKKRQKKGEPIPQAIVLVSDLAENSPPRLDSALPLLKEFGNPPLIVIHCGFKTRLTMDYPHAILPVNEFHPRLLQNIMAQIAKLTSKVAISEKEITDVVKARRILDEEIAKVELPERPKESLRPGYLEGILCRQKS
jgi:hypothetical protein